jgi:RNA recognition motif-containing protein
MAGVALKEGRSCTVFVGNLPQEMNHEAFIQVMRRAGSLKEIKIVFDHGSDPNTVYAFCTYLDPKSAMSTIRNLNGHEVVPVFGGGYPDSLS